MDGPLYDEVYKMSPEVILIGHRRSSLTNNGFKAARGGNSLFEPTTSERNSHDPITTRIVDGNC